MFLTTNRSIKGTIDQETGEPLATIDATATIEYDREAVERGLTLKNIGHSTLRDYRVFELAIDADGRPTIGDEVLL